MELVLEHFKSNIPITFAESSNGMFP